MPTTAQAEIDSVESEADADIEDLPISETWTAIATKPCAAPLLLNPIAR